MPVFKLILLGLLVLGCDDFKEPTPVDTTNSVSESPKSEMQEILTDELVSEKIFVAKIKAGDKVYFKIKGWREKSQFNTFTHRANAHWIKESCQDNSWQDENGDVWVSPSPKKPWINPSLLGPVYHDFDFGGCTYTDQKNVCEMRYRQKGPIHTEPIYPSESFLLYPLRIVLRDKFFPLKITSVGREFFEGVLEVTKEMLEVSDDLSLEVINPPPLNVEVGFLWFGSCPGRNEPTFKTDTSTETWTDQDFTRNKFLVSVTLETTP